MAMVCGLDLHRRQITFDTLEVDSGEEWRGRIGQPDRARFRRWLRDDVARRANGEVALAVEGCTGWRYVVEEISAAGFEAHVAEPADTQAARGRKHRAKTDRTDARLLRDLLAAGQLPESWIPPEPVLEWRERVRLYRRTVDSPTSTPCSSTSRCHTRRAVWRCLRGRPIHLKPPDDQRLPRIQHARAGRGLPTRRRHRRRQRLPHRAPVNPEPARQLADRSVLTLVHLPDLLEQLHPGPLRHGPTVQRHPSALVDPSRCGAKSLEHSPPSGGQIR